MSEYLLQHVPDAPKEIRMVSDDRLDSSLKLPSRWYPLQTDIIIKPWETVTVTLVLNSAAKSNHGPKERMVTSLPNNAPLACTLRRGTGNSCTAQIDILNTSCNPYVLQSATLLLGVLIVDEM